MIKDQKIISYLFPLLFLLGNSLNAQEKSDVINLETTDAEFLEGLIEKEINKLRKENGIHILEKDQALYSAAKDHSLYMRKKGEISHDQEKSKKADPFKRVKYFSGGHSVVGENIQAIPVKKEMRVRREKITLETYDEIAKAIVREWEDSEEHLKNILNPKYYKVGTGIAIDADNKMLYITQVYGSMPYRVPPGVDLPDDAHGVKPYNRSACLKLERSHGQLPELFSDNILFNEGIIYLYFNSLNMFKEVFTERDDAIAIDLVQRDQFKCGEGNRFYPSDVHEGMMMKPVNRNKMLRKNLLKDEGEVLVPLGQLPEIIDTTNTEFNLLIIKDGYLCNTIVYNNLRGENIEEINIPWAIDTVPASNNLDSIRKQFEFEIQFEQNKAEYKLSDIQPLLDSIHLKNHIVKGVDITAFSSLEGDVEKNRRLQQKRANSILNAMAAYVPDGAKTTVKTKENWDGFFASIEGSPYAEEYKGLSKEEVRAKINAMDTLDYNLEPYLKDQRKASVVITVESVHNDSALQKILRNRFDYAVDNGKYEKALLLQSIMFKNFLKGKLPSSILYEGYEIFRKKKTLPLKNNILAFTQRYKPVNNRDSLRKYLDKKLLPLMTVNEDYPFIRYNDLVLELQEWSDNYKVVKDTRSLRKEIKSLYGSKIPRSSVHKLMLGFYLVAADYYFEQKEFDKRDKALGEIRELFMKDDLDSADIDRISDYFIFQMRIKWAMDIIKPVIHKNEEVNEHFLFKFLTIMVYDDDLKETEKYYDYFKQAASVNKDRFCKLFGYPNMSFQLLSDQKIKSIYCSECSDNSSPDAKERR